MSTPFIPRVTREKLLNPAVPGTRHRQMFDIAMSLIGNGFYPEAVYVQLRHMFPAIGNDLISDGEIRSIVDAVVEYNPQPSTPGCRRSGLMVTNPIPSRPASSPTLEVEAFLKGYRVGEEEIISRSPMAIPPESWQEARVVIKHLFGHNELVNLVSERTVHLGGKFSPVGYGEFHTAARWLDLIADRQAVPQSEAGCWIRLNPTDGRGIHDSSITSFRHTLLEFDEIALESQLAFFAKIRLPIAALVNSGGKSVHAWVRIGAPDAQAYRTQVTELYSALERFGIDRANRNPSRLARMPGARRRDSGARNGGRQKLLYLNPNPTGRAIAETTIQTREVIHE